MPGDATAVGDAYFLGSWSSKSEHAPGAIDLRLELTREEFEAYTAAIEAYGALHARTAYDLLWKHRNRLGSMVAAYSNVERLGGNFIIARDGMNDALVDEIISWLAVGKLYLESTEQFMRSRFGDRSSQLQAFQRAKRAASAGSPGYRFVQKLRAYMQHEGLPLSGTHISRGRDQPRAIEMFVGRTELLRGGFDWGSSVRRWLSTMPDQIAVMPIIVEAIRGYHAIEEEVLRILLAACFEAIPKLREGIDRLVPSADQNASLFREKKGAEESGALNLSITSFPRLSDLERLEAAAATPDALSDIRRPVEAPRATPAMRHANKQAAAVMGVWLESHGEGRAVEDAMAAVIAEDGGPINLMHGLVNLSAHSTLMLGQFIGSPPQSLIDFFTSEPADDDEPQPGTG